MKRKRLNSLLKAVEKERKIAEVRYKENKEASEDMQKTAACSWSGAGDREYAKGQEEINRSMLHSLESLYAELKDALNIPIPNKVADPCFVKYKYGGDVREIYLVENVVNVEGFSLISKNSPLGSTLLDKRVRDDFKFKIESKGKRRALKGEIIEIA